MHKSSNSYKISKYIEYITFKDDKSQSAGLLVFSTRTDKMRVIKLEDWNLLQKSDFGLVADNIIKDLENISVLVPFDQDEYEAVVKENEIRDEYDKNLYYTIMVTANCSFCCDYCGQGHSSKLLSQESQNLIIQRLEERIKSKSFKALKIVWFGGEPILGISVINSLSPRLQNLASDYNLEYHATMTTNGYHLSSDIVASLANEHKIHKFYITLDGVGEVHDKRRCLKSKGPTFERVYINLQALVNFIKTSHAKIGIVIRCNIDNRNEDSGIELVRKLKADGLEKYIEMQLASVHPWGNDVGKIELERSNFAQIEIEILTEIIQLGFNVKCLPKRRHGMCIATSKYSEMIDPYGEVYPCSEVGLVPTYVKNCENIYKIDDLKNKYKKIVYLEKRNQFVKSCAQKKLNLVCRECKIFPACLGMCPKQWNDGVMPCPTAKYNLKEKLLLHYIMERDKLSQAYANR